MQTKKIFIKAKEMGIDELELSVSSSNKFSFSIFHGKVEKYSIADNTTLSARGIVNGKMGIASTENLNDTDSLLKNVLNNAKAIEDDKEVLLFAGSSKYAKGLKYVDNLTKMTTQEKIDLALKAEKLAFAADSRIIEVGEVEYEEVRTEKSIINSKGLKKSFKQNYGVLVIEVVAKEGEDVKTGFNYEFFVDPTKLDVEKLVKEAVDDACAKLNGTPCASKKYKTILSPNAFASLIGILMSSVSGDAVNKGKSMLKDKLNEQIASPKLTLTENPLSKEYPFYYRNFDDEGVATYKKNIIEKGVLKTFIYDLESAKKANVEPTGNGYKSRGAISPDVSFLEVKPGKKSKDELLASVKDGIYIDELIGLHAGINPLSGNFSLQSNGFLFKDGKKVQAVNLITTAGNLFDLFKDIKEVGADSKLNMSIKCPSVVIKSLAISGK